MHHSMHHHRTMHHSSFGHSRHSSARYHQLSTGGDGTFVETGGSVCLKKEYNTALIILGILFILFCIIFIILLSTVPIHFGNVCNGIENVSVGAAEVCSLESYFKHYGDAYFSRGKSDAIAYQYPSYPNLKSVVKNSTFTFKENVKSDGFSVFTIKLGLSAKVHYRYQFSSRANVYILDNSQYRDYCSHGKIRGSYNYAEFSTLKSERTFELTSSPMHIVIENKNSKKIKVTEEGWLYGQKLLMDPNLARRICYGSCVFNHPDHTVIYITHAGTQRTVPVTMLLDYRFNDNMIPVFVILPFFIFATGLTFVILCLCRRRAPEELPPIPMDETPNGVPATAETPSGAVVVPADPTDAPPAYGIPVQDAAYVTVVATQDSAVPVTVLPVAPNPGQKPDVYGVSV